MFINTDAIPPTGSGILDAAHVRLAEVVNQAYESWRRTQDKAALRDSFWSLLVMVERHFVQEEHIIRAAGYEHWAEHGDVHQEILADLRLLVEHLEVIDWTEPEVSEAFGDIESLLYDHECSDDMDFQTVLGRREESIRDTEPLIAWSRRYLTGIPEIDQEHRDLVKLANKVHVNMVSGAGTRAVELSLDELLGEVACHFATEEMYMEREGAPGQAVHRILHDNLLKELGLVVQSYHSGRFTDVDAVLQKRIKFWLMDHIVNVDMDMARGRRPAL